MLAYQLRETKICARTLILLSKRSCRAASSCFSVLLSTDYKDQPSENATATRERTNLDEAGALLHSIAAGDDYARSDGIVHRLLRNLSNVRS